MPFHENTSLFIEPVLDSDIIWRFIDFPKFIGLLEDQALYFCRSDRLPDDFEGHYSKPPLKGNVTDVSATSPPKHYYDVRLEEDDSNFIKQRNVELRKSVFINCWNLSNYESYSLWRLYSAKKGVAIQSTFGKLKESLRSSSELINIGRVTYIDWDKDNVPVGNSLYPFVYKRNNFKSENELRALYCDFHNRHNNIFGVKIPVDLETLIQNIFIYPMSSQWHHDLIKSILKRYYLKIGVLSSKLSDKPD